jgi:hypothetical protein
LELEVKGQGRIHGGGGGCQKAIQQKGIMYVFTVYVHLRVSSSRGANGGDLKKTAEGKEDNGSGKKIG